MSCTRLFWEVNARAVAEGQLAVQVFPGVSARHRQRIDCVVMIANDRNVVRDGADRRIIFVNAFELSVFRRPHVGVAAEADVYGLIYSLDFPGIAGLTSQLSGSSTCWPSTMRWLNSPYW